METIWLCVCACVALFAIVRQENVTYGIICYIACPNCLSPSRVQAVKIAATQRKVHTSVHLYHFHIQILIVSMKQVVFMVAAMPKGINQKSTEFPAK